MNSLESQNPRYSRMPRGEAIIAKTSRSRRLIVACISIYALICVVMFFAQRSILFVPSHRDELSSLKPWLHEGETIGFCREVAEPVNVWLMMHGNAGQAAMRDYVLPRMSDEDALYVLEYPGYGFRAGRPGREPFNQAAAQAYRILRQQFPNSKIGVIGESIGSGPACALASENQPPDKIVLIVPFDTLERVVSGQFFWLPVRALLLDKWNNVEALRNYRGPVDIFAAKDDEIIPVKHARKLSEQTPNGTFIEFPGGHNEWSESPKVKIRFQTATVVVH